MLFSAGKLDCTEAACGRATVLTNLFRGPDVKAVLQPFVAITPQCAAIVRQLWIARAGKCLRGGDECHRAAGAEDVLSRGSGAYVHDWSMAAERGRYVRMESASRKYVFRAAPV